MYLTSAPDRVNNHTQVVEITPPALQNIGWRTYIIFAVFNIVQALIVYCFYPETAGQTLESIDELFRNHDTSVKGESTGWASAMQWSMVPKANGVVRRLRADKRAQAEGAAREEGASDAPEKSETVSIEKEKAGEMHVENAAS